MFACLGTAAQVKEKKIRKYGKTICDKDLRTKLSVIASAEMQGRETATDGQRKAAAYLEDQFRRLGLQPGNGGSFYQAFPLVQDSLTKFDLQVNGRQLQPNKDYSLFVSGMAAGDWNISNVHVAGTGPLDTTNLPVAGKWVLIEEGSFFQLRQKIAQLRRRQAAGIIAVSKTFPRPTPFALKGPMGLRLSDDSFPYVTISYNAASQLLNKQGLDSASLAVLPKQEYPASMQLQVGKQRLRVESTNVLAVLPGTDKAGEYVFLTAHYDHLGQRGDSVIYYGADDDGSGTTALIEIAEAFAKAKKKGHGPRRSLVFMAVSGEEKGLLGSEYYADNPVFPLEKTTVDLNIDMVGRIDPKYTGDSMNYVYVIGDDKLSSDLRPITDSVNRTYMNMELDRRYTDVKDPNRYYYRSDHYNFAKKGVPIIFYFNGTHADYHRPTDTIDKINFDLMEKRVKLVFYTAWDMANREQMLKRDIPLLIPPR